VGDDLRESEEGNIMKKYVLVLLALLVSVPVYAQANLQADVATARAKYPTPMSAAQQAAVVNEVAWKHRAEGWAVLGKPGGNNCPQPRTGAPLSCDFLVYKPTLSGFDVLSDAEGAGRVQWDGPKPGVAASQVVEAVEPEGAVEPPPPPPPGDFVTHDEMRAAFEALSARIAKLEAGSTQPGTPPPAGDNELAVLKQILAVLQAATKKLGVQ
jgi:hypothetical protein